MTRQHETRDQAERHQQTELRERINQLAAKCELETQLAWTHAEPALDCGWLTSPDD